MEASCGICYQKYQSRSDLSDWCALVPVSISPCGHDICLGCASRLSLLDPMRCHICRSNISRFIPNYGLDRVIPPLEEGKRQENPILISDDGGDYANPIVIKEDRGDRHNPIDVDHPDVN